MNVVPLKFVAHINMGTAPPGNTYNTSGDGTPMIAGAGDYGDVFPNPKKWTTSPTSLAEPGDLIVCVRATIGDLNWADKEYCLGRGVAGLRPRNGKIDIKYLAHFIASKKRQLTSLGTGSTFLAIRRGDLENLAIPVPPIEKQRQIGAILDKADAIRRKRKDAIRLTKDFLRSTFLEMFGDPMTNPKGWPIYRLGNYLTFVTSGSRGWAQYYASTGARFIRSLDVQMNHISDSDAVFVNPPDSAETRRTLVCPNDVLLTITGSRIGRVAPINSSVGEAYISQHVAILRLNSSMRPCFLSMFLSEARGGQHQIQRMQYGQTKPGLNLEQLRSFEIPCPLLSMQDLFVSIWDRFDMHIQYHAIAEQQTENLFNSLVQRAFRGEL